VTSASAFDKEAAARVPRGLIEPYDLYPVARRLLLHEPDCQAGDRLPSDSGPVEPECYLWSEVYPAILAAETLDPLSVRFWCRFAAGMIAICPSRRVNIAFRSSR